jgi:hypothetical protein
VVVEQRLEALPYAHRGYNMHSPNILTPLTACKPNLKSLVDGVVVAIDSWGWLVGRKFYTDPLFFKLRRLYGRKRVLHQPLWKGKYSPWVLKVHQPPPDIIFDVNNYRPINSKKPQVYLIDIAYDFIPRNEYQADFLTELIQEQVVQTWRRDQSQANNYKGTFYAKDDKFAHRNVATYFRASKVTGQLCAHVELRFRGEAARKLANNYDFMKGLDADEVKALLEHQAKAYDLKSTYVDKEVRGLLLSRDGRFNGDEADKIKPQVKNILVSGLLGLYQEGVIESFTDIRDHERALFKKCFEATEWSTGDIRWHNWSPTPDMDYPVKGLANCGGGDVLTKQSQSEKFCENPTKSAETLEGKVIMGGLY